MSKLQKRILSADFLASAEKKVRRQGGFLYVDCGVNLETFNQIRNMSANAKRKDDFIFVNFDNSGTSKTYSPIVDGDAEQIASRIATMRPLWSDDPKNAFFRQVANEFLIGAIDAFKKCEIDYTLEDIALTLSSTARLETLLDSVKRCLPNHPNSLNLEIMLNGFRSPDAGELEHDRLLPITAMVAETILNVYRSFPEVVGNRHPELSLANAINEQKIIYFALPQVLRPVDADISSLFFKDLAHAIDYFGTHEDIEMRGARQFSIFFNGHAKPSFHDFVYERARVVRINLYFDHAPLKISHG